MYNDKIDLQSAVISRLVIDSFFLRFDNSSFVDFIKLFRSR